jgi:hypothetical protein
MFLLVYISAETCGMIIKGTGCLIAVANTSAMCAKTHCHGVKSACPITTATAVQDFSYTP